MQQDNANAGQINIYGCGGAGINNAAYFNNAALEDNCAHIRPCFIDASRSNLTTEFNEEDIFILENVDGSGKLRTENHQEISNVIKQILVQMTPGDLNVVVFSASGGSGSVIGPLLLAELLRQGETALCVVVGSDESIITANNTLNTLKSLESIAKRTETPVCMFYEHNDRQRKRSEVDTQIHLAITTLAIMTYKGNREIDSRDLANWVQFHRVTSVEPQLAQFEVFSDPDMAARIKDPISVVSIYGDADTPQIDMVPEYHAAGYMVTPGAHFDQLHYVISIDAMPNIVGNIKETLDNYQTQRNSRVKQKSILGEDDNTTDDGLVL